MAAIPGWAFIGVGIAIAAYSKFVSARSEGTNSIMTIFFYIGLALLVFGVFKFLFQYMTREKKTPTPADGLANHIICPRCNAKLHPRSRFCNWCGTQQ